MYLYSYVKRERLNKGKHYSFIDLYLLRLKKKKKERERKIMNCLKPYHRLKIVGSLLLR